FGPATAMRDRGEVGVRDVGARIKSRRKVGKSRVASSEDEETLPFHYGASLNVVVVSRYR
ncbi:hypothetical protein FRC15_003678, partial [Serendipita sp. 397]